jgi:carbon-monoxide dehydrogenase medium subunit
MRGFSYHKPKDVGEAIAFLGKYGEKASILAGGTDLLVELKKRLKAPSHIIDIKGISSLDRITLEPGGHLRIGSLVTMATLGKHPALVNGLGVLSMAASKLGSWQVRNRATLGGNICNASPSGETLPALLCLNAQLKLEGTHGERVVPVEDFFLGPGESAAAVGEILTEIVIPPPPDKSFGVYKKLALRKAMDLAVIGVAVLGFFDLFGDCFKDIRIGLGAVAPTPIRAKKAEIVLTGKRVNGDLIEEAASVASSESRPLTDIRGSEWYRREMIRHLVEESIREILERCRENTGRT